MTVHIVTVQGTGEHRAELDHAANPDGSKAMAWWHPESLFAQILTTNLNEVTSGQGGVEWQSMDSKAWSCANSENARIRAGRALAKKLIALSSPDDKNEQILLIAYSHGGNVALEALADLHRRGVKHSRLLKNIRLSLIGTPILSYKTKGLNYWSRLLMGGFLPSLIGSFFAALVLLVASLIAGAAAPDALSHGSIFYAFSAGWFNFSHSRPIVAVLIVTGLICAVWAPLYLHIRMNDTKKRVDLMNQLASNDFTAPTAGKSEDGGAKTQDLTMLEPGFDKKDITPDEPKPSDEKKVLAHLQALDKKKQKAHMTRQVADVLKQAMVVFTPRDEAFAVVKWASERRQVSLTTPNFVVGITKAILLVFVFIPLAIVTALASPWLAKVIFLSACFAPAQAVPAPLNYLPFWILLPIEFAFVWLLSWPFSKSVSPIINAFARVLVRQRVLGDDNFARPIETVTQTVPQRAGLPKWNPMAFAAEHEKFVHRNSGKAWEQIRSSIIFARLTENWNLLAQLEQSTHVTWNSLLHTTYFMSPLTVHFIAYVVLRSLDMFREKDDLQIKIFPPNWKDVYEKDNEKHKEIRRIYESLAGDQPLTNTFAAELERMRPTVTGAPSNKI